MAVPDDRALANLWNAGAPTWADEQWWTTNPGKRYIALPTFRRLWGDLRGRRVLDAGCGGGWLTRVVADEGATVAAVDFSSELIAAARRLDPRSGASYHVANLCDLGIFSDGGFDLLVSHCCLQDVSDFRGALREIGRVLRPGAGFIVSVVHPWTWQFDAHWRPRSPGGPFAGWVDDPRYLTEQFSGRNMFHRPLAAYAEALTDAGLQLRGLLEPRPGDELQPVIGSDPRWDRWRRVPDFAFFHGVREGLPR